MSELNRVRAEVERVRRQRIPVMPLGDDYPELCGDVPEQEPEGNDDGIAEGAEGNYDE